MNKVDQYRALCKKAEDLNNQAEKVEDEIDKLYVSMTENERYQADEVEDEIDNLYPKIHLSPGTQMVKRLE